MDDETMRTFITCGFTFGGILVSNLLVFLGTRTNERKTKQVSILEQQYKNFFVPLHRAIFFSEMPYYEVFHWCERLIEDNYELVPPKIKTDFLKCQKDAYLSNEFENNINYCYIVLSNKLGYSSIKLDSEYKEIAQDILLDTFIFPATLISLVDYVFRRIQNFKKK